jgi:amphi-Trp domain-containing protein
MTSNSGSEEKQLETPTVEVELEVKDEAKDDEEDEDDEDDEDEEKDEKKEKKKDKKKKEKDEKKDKPKKVEIEYEAAMPRAEAVSYFEALVGGLRSGHLEFRQDDRVLVLAPPDHVEVEVTAQQKGDKCKVVFEIEWNGSKRPLAIVNEAAAKADESESDD